MYEVLIRKYLSKLTLNDINNFANKNNMPLKQGEDMVIYNFIMNYWQILYKGNSSEVFLRLKPLVSNETYNNAIILYNRYKNKDL